jgi:M6 family metalloprotease-like protein
MRKQVNSTKILSLLYRGLGLFLLTIFINLFFLRTLKNTSAAISSTLSGTLRVAQEDDFNTGTSKTRYYVQETNNNLTETFPAYTSDLKAGSVVNLNGGDLTVTSGSFTNTESNAINGTTKIAVILANFNNLSVSSPTKSQAKTLMDTKFSPFFAENSFNKATMTGDVFGWVTLNIASTCDLATYAPKAIEAADSQIDFNLYKYVMIVFPNSNCPYSGIAYIPPGVNYTTGEGTKLLLVSALPSNVFSEWVQTSGIHEVGHNLGLTHANGWECGSESVGLSCSKIDYGDKFDVMGGGGFIYQPHYGIYFKEFLGWITNTNVKVVTASGNYTIDKLESLSGGVMSLKIPREGTSTYYNVENRTATGKDSTLPSNALAGGLIKIIPNSVNGTSSPDDTFLIDATPNSSSTDDFNDAGFILNKTFTDSERGINITPTSKTNGVLSVNVNFFAPSLVSPGNGGTATGGYFNWSDIPARTNYTIQISRTADFSNLLVNTSVSDSQYYASGLPASLTVYWRVRANYSFGSSDWSVTYTALTPASVTAMKFCPAGSVTRDFIAQYVLKAIKGSSYQPPAASGTLFTDVPKTLARAEWIEQFARDGYSAGCGGGKYCPTGTVKREEMAVFLLRVKYGSSFVPPAATGKIFTDMTDPKYWATAWVEKAFNEGLTAGCQISPRKFCPTNIVARDQMSVFMLRIKYGFGFTPPSGTGKIFTDVTNPTNWSTAWIEKVYLDGIIDKCN